MSEEIISILDNIGLNPIVVISFGHRNNLEQEIKGVVHSDVMFYNNNYYKVPFAINYELTDTNPLISWYDLDIEKEIYPPIRNNFVDEDEKNQMIYASGIHYGGKYGRAHQENHSINFQPTFQTHLSNKYPKLINTSLPHSVRYKGYYIRLALSIRFSIENKITYEQVLELLKPFIVKNNTVI